MIIVIVALESELSRQPLPPGCRLVHSGVGKVNAAIAACTAIHAHRPALLVNYGTAGSINPSAHGLVEVSAVIQRDMIAMPFAPRGATPFDSAAPQLSNGGPGLRCATGDSFLTRPDPWLMEQQVDLVDMELFAVARACQSAHVPWRSFKFITDQAGPEAAADWHSRVGNGELMFMERLRALGTAGAAQH